MSIGRRLALGFAFGLGVNYRLEHVDGESVVNLAWSRSVICRKPVHSLPYAKLCREIYASISTC